MPRPLTGIAVLGVVTALIASWFVRMGKSEESQNDRIEAKMDAILAVGPGDQVVILIESEKD